MSRIHFSNEAVFLNGQRIDALPFTAHPEAHMVLHSVPDQQVAHGEPVTWYLVEDDGPRFFDGWELQSEAARTIDPWAPYDGEDIPTGCVADLWDGGTYVACNRPAEGGFCPDHLATLRQVQGQS
jgi:hypothetical protein